ADTVSGQKASAILVDELWLFGKKLSSENVLSEVEGSLAARPEGFIVYLSTQSDEPPAGVYKAKLRYARDVRDGTIRDPRFLAVIYEFPESILKDDAWRFDERLWRIPNPNLGRSVNPTYLRSKLAEAENNGKAARNLFVAKHFNIEIGMNQRSDRWAGTDFWQGCADPALTLEEVLRRCEVATVGIDGGGLDDLLGLAVLGRETGTRRWLLWSHAWAHRCVLERRKEIASQLLDFERERTLTLVDDDSDADVKGAVDRIEQVRDAGLLADGDAIGVDRIGAPEIVDELELRGFDARTERPQVRAIRQGYDLQSAVLTVERRLAAKTLRHGGTGLMAFAVGNAKVEIKGNAVLITKQAAGVAKIDPLMALFNAAALMSLNPEAAGGTSYLEEADELVVMD
ncbi:MAG TPA: terminase TerL endonuclease subunit, partial [Beijerinckiaceae bacterium]|nr:terminase TerL endonuclease subunit [Beijerinckiaceae bacterium]